MLLLRLGPFEVFLLLLALTSVFFNFFSLIWKLEVREKVKNLRKCYLFSSVNQYTPTGSGFWHAISKFQSETLTGEAALWGKSPKYAIKSPFLVLKIQSFHHIKLQTWGTSAEYITKRLSLYWALILFFQLLSKFVWEKNPQLKHHLHFTKKCFIKLFYIPHLIPTL